jgi:DNA-directed RNA polymerase subunit M/transcription elongation factor TFIIS
VCALWVLSVPIPYAIAPRHRSRAGRLTAAGESSRIPSTGGSVSEFKSTATRPTGVTLLPHKPARATTDTGPEHSAVPEPPAPACPRCHSSNIVPQTLRSDTDAEFTYYHCNACSHMWIVRKADSQPS